MSLYLSAYTVRLHRKLFLLQAFPFNVEVQKQLLAVGAIVPDVENRGLDSVENRPFRRTLIFRK